MTSPPSSKLNLDTTQPTKPEPFSKSSRDPLSRETPRNKLAAHLVAQAIRSLSEIWRPQDIPTSTLTTHPPSSVTAHPPDNTRSSSDWFESLNTAPRIPHGVIQDPAESYSQLEIGLNTVRIHGEDGIDSSVANTASESLLSPSPDPPPLLLYPHHAFLASLILASKFT
ncbi:hypothetical protein BDN72DRAFT_905021 [Pluteus cervinus]|uniref:Uncharacterized protein n=1 Tax=Pluteus cervinus TaxID=181527 RepID=A0ACD3A3W0_9AGAR|nr:hypothetical protein BDN72DRAFT_905021 [Pluteus cervinus]